MGVELTGQETAQERKAVFENFVEQEFDGDYAQGRMFFEEVMY